MRRTHPSALAAVVAAVLGGLLAAGPAAAQKHGEESNVKAIHNGGMDGGFYSWQVRCKSGRSASLVLEDATVILCAHPFNQPKQCARADEDWTIEAAAAAACS